MVTLKYLGANSLYISDDDSSILIDPYFSRHRRVIGPGYFFRRIIPDIDNIKYAFEKGKIGQVDAILISHTHFDHAGDLDKVADITKAQIYGSKSVAKIIRNDNINRFVSLRDEETYIIKSLRITPIATEHQSFPMFLKPISNSARIIRADIYRNAAFRYKCGQVYSFKIESNKKSILVISSPYANNAVYNDIDILLLAVGGLKFKSKSYIENLAQKAIIETNAKKVIFTHWDNFQKPLYAEKSMKFVSNKEIDLIIDYVNNKSNVDFILPNHFDEIRLSS